MYENLNVSFPLVWLPISDFHKRQLMRSSIRCYDWFSDTHLFENLISFTPAIYISTNQEPITWAPAQIQFYELKGVVQNPSIKTSFIVQCWLLQRPSSESACSKLGLRHFLLLCGLPHNNSPITCSQFPVPTCPSLILVSSVNFPLKCHAEN